MVENFNKIFNKVLNVLKFILLFLVFIMVVYIQLFMYYKLESSEMFKSFLEFLIILLPFALTLLLFVINFLMKQNFVNNNILYNSGCVIAFVSILFICYRSLFDVNMIFRNIEGFDINFTYFNDQFSYIKILLYLICFVNGLLIIKNKFSLKRI